MKQVMRNHELYGNVLYRKGRWKKNDPLKCSYNNSTIEIPVEMILVGIAYIEYELGISNLILEYATPERIAEIKQEYIKYDKRVSERYTQYLLKLNDTMKQVEKVIINDYNRYRKEWTDEEIKKYNTVAIAKKILKVVTPEEILGLVKIKHIIVYGDRVVLELRCPWYPQSDAGIVLEENGSMQIGLGEMMQ